jgi:hypothetical protein
MSIIHSFTLLSCSTKENYSPCHHHNHHTSPKSKRCHCFHNLAPRSIHCPAHCNMATLWSHVSSNSHFCIHIIPACPPPGSRCRSPLPLPLSFSTPRLDFLALAKGGLFCVYDPMSRETLFQWLSWCPTARSAFVLAIIAI